MKRGTPAETAAAWYEQNRQRKLAYQRDYRARNLAARLAYDRQRRRAHPDEMRAKDRARHERDKERRNAARRARVAADREATNAAKRAYYEANPEACRAAAARSRKRNAARVLSNNAARRAREKGAPVVERVDRVAIFARDRGVCRICGTAVDPKRFHLDHWIPLTRGGEHTARNLFVAHPRCNIRKKNHMPQDHGRAS